MPRLMPDVADIIVDNIGARLEIMGIETTRITPYGLSFWGPISSNLQCEVDSILYVIICDQRRAVVYDYASLYGAYLYADPDFYAGLIKRVRMLVKPTSIFHVWQADTNQCMPSILDE